MKKKKWLRGVALSVGALVVVVAVSGLVSCANLFGSDDGGGGGGVSDVDPTGTWLVVLDTPTEGPTGTVFQAALAEIDDTQFSIVFYGDDTAQVAGLKGSYEVDGDAVNCLMNIGWFPEDPQNPTDENAPQLKGTYHAIDWYEVVEDDAMALSVTIDGTTLYGGGEGEIEFEKVSFSRPLDLVNNWVNDDGDVQLHGAGIWTYTNGSQTGGGPRWEVSGLTEGYMRQVYNNISDEEPLDYKEYLSPHEMPDANTLRFYHGYDLASADSYEYTASE